MDTRLWMARDLLTVTPDTPLATAARRMAERRVRHLLVVAPDAKHTLLGIVSSHDLYLAAESGVNPFSPRAVDRDQRTIGSIMTPHPQTIPSATPLADAARILRDRKFGCLPVVDDGTLVGVLTEHDILRAFARWTGADQRGCEITAVAAPGRDALGELNQLATRHGLRLTSASSFAHDGRDLLVLHVAGDANEAFVDALWRSGLSILRVRRTDAAAVPLPQPARA